MHVNRAFSHQIFFSDIFQKAFLLLVLVSAFFEVSQLSMLKVKVMSEYFVMYCLDVSNTILRNRVVSLMNRSFISCITLQRDKSSLSFVLMMFSSVSLII
jgi:hypothetical protein